jgi:hypothetical protein
MSSSHDAHAWFVEQRAAFVTRALDADEYRVFAEHVVACVECTDAVAQIEHELRWLPIGVGPALVRPGLRGEIARAVLEQQPGRASRQLPRLLAVAAGLFLVAVSAWSGAQYGRRDAQRLANEVQAKSGEIAMLRDTISVMRQASRVLSASIALDGRDGGLLIFADDVSHRWNVVLHGLPAAPEGQAYQFWFITSDGMVRSVSLAANDSGPAFATLEMPPQGGTVMGASLTLEPMDERANGPMGKKLAEIML